MSNGRRFRRKAWNPMDRPWSILAALGEQSRAENAEAHALHASTRRMVADMRRAAAHNELLAARDRGMIR